MQPKGKSALLVLDLANVSGLFATYAPRAASGDSAQIDLNKLRSALGSISQVPITEAIACTHTNDGRERYVSIVRACGYRAVTRPLRTVSDGQGGAHRICNMDAEVAAEAMLRSKDHDTVIIGSGDADFAPLVDSLKADGKRVYVAAHNRGVATELLNAAGRTNFIDLGSYHNAVRLRPELPQEFPGRRLTPSCPLKNSDPPLLAERACSWSMGNSCVVPAKPRAGRWIGASLAAPSSRSSGRWQESRYSTARPHLVRVCTTR